MTHLTPGKLIINFGDTHVYSNHLDAVHEQCSRLVKHRFPRLDIQDGISLDTLSADDIKLIDYQHQPGIKADMAV